MTNTNQSPPDGTTILAEKILYPVIAGIDLKIDSNQIIMISTDNNREWVAVTMEQWSLLVYQVNQYIASKMGDTQDGLYVIGSDQA